MPVCVGPDRNPEDRFAREAAQVINITKSVTSVSN